MTPDQVPPFSDDSATKISDANPYIIGFLAMASSVRQGALGEKCT